MSRLENDIFGNASGQVALDAMITRLTDALFIWLVTLQKKLYYLRWTGVFY
jgi:hypothetical protein